MRELKTVTHKTYGSTDQAVLKKLGLSSSGVCVRTSDLLARFDVERDSKLPLDAGGPRRRPVCEYFGPSYLNICTLARAETGTFEWLAYKYPGIMKVKLYSQWSC